VWRGWHFIDLHTPKTESEKDAWEVWDDFWLTHGRFIDSIRKVFFSDKVNQYIKLRDTFAAKLLLRKSIVCDTDNIYVFMYNFRPNLRYFQSSHAQKMISQNANLVYLFGDSVKYLTAPVFKNNGETKQVFDAISVFPSILSYCYSDCEQLGYQYMPLAYPSASNLPVKHNPEYDFSLFQNIRCVRKPGTEFYDPEYDFDSNNRVVLTKKLIETANCNDAKFLHHSDSDFNVFDEWNNVESDTIKDNFLARVGDANCVVAFTQFGENYLSYTVFQGFYYGRKILTDAVCVKMLKCYDERWVKVVESPDEIDDKLIEWMKKREDVQYSNVSELSMEHDAELIRGIVRKRRVELSIA
jgi:hypothetical protein